MIVREATDRDIEQWIYLRRQLWPQCSLEEHSFEVRSILRASNATAFLAVDEAGSVPGFVELSIRNCAEGCDSTRVGYVEGIFVSPERRGRGVSNELFHAGELWALRRGCFEMGSDTEIGNRRSLSVHRRAGYSEIERTIHLRKSPLLEGELNAYCSSLSDKVYGTYVRSSQPWEQSGFSGPEDRWVACRKPIADCITKPGSFLDIGCANGYLLESVLGWTADRGLKIEPFGIDLLEELVSAARARLPDHADRIWVGNAFTWNPATRFDWVRTELCYVPGDFRRAFVSRLIALFLKLGGVLLVAEYHSTDDFVAKWESETLKGMGFGVSETKSGYWEGKELTRVSVLPRELNA